MSTAEGVEARSADLYFHAIRDRLQGFIYLGGGGGGGKGEASPPQNSLASPPKKRLTISLHHR